MEPVLAYRDEQQNKENRQKWQGLREGLQVVADLYSATGLPKLAGGDLGGLLNDTDNFMFDKITGSQEAHLTIGTGDNRSHLPIEKSKAIEILQKPAGYEALMEAVKGVSVAASPLYAIRARVNDSFLLSEGGRVEFTETKEAELAAQGNQYINSEKGARAHSFIQDIAKAYFNNGIDTLALPHTGGDAVEGILLLIRTAVNKIDAKSKVFTHAKDWVHKANQL